jgi:hypothetical protein
MCTPLAGATGAVPLAMTAGKKVKGALTPNIPAPPPPPQEGKDPDTMAERRRRRPGAMGGGSILTSPSGIANSTLNTGGNTILGG